MLPKMPSKGKLQRELTAVISKELEPPRVQIRNGLRHKFLHWYDLSPFSFVFLVFCPQGPGAGVYFLIELCYMFLAFVRR